MAHEDSVEFQGALAIAFLLYSNCDYSNNIQDKQHFNYNNKRAALTKLSITSWPQDRKH